MKKKITEHSVPGLLNLKQVLEISERLEKGETGVSLAKEFNVTPFVISKIKKQYCDSYEHINRNRYSKEFKDSAVKRVFETKDHDKVSKELNINRATLLKWVRNANIEYFPKRKDGKKGGRKVGSYTNTETVKEAVKLYYDGKKALEISKILNVGYSTVNRWLKNEGISQRVSHMEHYDRVIDLYGKGYPVTDISIGLDIHPSIIYRYINLHEQKKDGR